MAFMFFLPEMLFFQISAELSPPPTGIFWHKLKLPTHPSLELMEVLQEAHAKWHQTYKRWPVKRLGEPSHCDASRTHVKREERKEGWVWCSSDKVLARLMLSPRARVTTGGVLHPTAGFSIPTMMSHWLGAALGKCDLSMNVAVGATDETTSQWRSPQQETFMAIPPPHCSYAPSCPLVCFFRALINIW